MGCNDGPEFGQFGKLDLGKVHGYRIEIARQDFINAFSDLFWQVLSEVKAKDAATGAMSEFRRMGYVPLNAAFAYPLPLAGALKTHLIRDHVFPLCPGPARRGQFVINSVDTVNASGPVVISGRGWH